MVLTVGVLEASIIGLFQHCDNVGFNSWGFGSLFQWSKRALQRWLVLTVEVLEVNVIEKKVGFNKVGFNSWGFGS